MIFNFVLWPQFGCQGHHFAEMTTPSSKMHSFCNISWIQIQEQSLNFKLDYSWNMLPYMMKELIKTNNILI